jgi:phage terminase small subunit
VTLTKKRLVFINEYLRCWNATHAADAAGYKHPDRQGSRLLSFVEVETAIQARLDTLVMSANEVLVRLSEMARNDIGEFISDQGIIDWKMVSEKGYLIRKVRHTEGKQSEIELYDAKDALVWIGKHHGLFVEQQEITLTTTTITSDDLAQAEAELADWKDDRKS